MTKKSKFRSPLSLILAVVLILCGACVGWLAIRATATEMLSAGNTQASAIAWRPEVILGDAMRAYVANKGRVRPQSLSAVRQAAAETPLDDRPYLLIGTDYLRSGQVGQAVKALEAARRLNPRRPWTHLLLLERYLRGGNFAPATEEFAVLARLVDSAQTPIAGALAQMSVAPETRDAVRMTLRQDAGLEQSVLAALASGDIEPSVIFGMASPAAWASANIPGGWGTVLVDRLIKEGHYHNAHAVWQRISGIKDQQVAPLLYNAGLGVVPGKPPFNWSLVSDNVAAVDLLGNKMEVNYYGRDSGQLAGQLLLLQPGTYRFGYVVSGIQRGAGPTLLWSFTCANQPDHTLASLPLPPTAAAPVRVTASLTVPENCPAQQLQLIGQAGEFPTPVSATIEHLQLERLQAK